MAFRNAVLLALVAVVRTQVRLSSHPLADRQLHRIASRQTHLESAKVIPFSRDPCTVSVHPRSMLPLETSTSPAPRPNVYAVPRQPNLDWPRDEDTKHRAETPIDDRAPAYPPWMWSGHMPVDTPKLTPQPEGESAHKWTVGSEPKPINPRSSDDAKSAIENLRAARRKQYEDAAKVMDCLIDWGTTRKHAPELSLDEGDLASYVAFTDRSKPINVYPLPKISVGGKPQPRTVYDKKRIFTDLQRPTQ